MDATDRAQDAAEDAAPSEEDAHEGMSRLGLAGHGVYYLLLALLASQLIGPGGGGGEQTDAQGAIDTVVSQPFGKFLLIGLTLAFVAYALRRWIRVWQEDGLGSKARNALSGAVWVFLTVLAAQQLSQAFGGPGGGGGGGGGSGSQGTSVTRSILELPGGTFIVAAIGVFLIGVAAYHLRKASDDHLADELGELGLDGRRIASVLGRVGYGGRSLAYALVGVFVIRAAMNHDASAGKGMDGALRQVQQASWGPWVLLAVTIGFAAFGAFRLLEARYADNPE